MANITYIPYAQQQAAIDRQRKYAELMQQQAAQPLESQQVSGIVVPTSPWLGLAKMLQAGLGGYAERKAAQRESELETQQREEAKKSIQDFVAASGPQKRVTQVPLTKDITQAAGPEDYQDIMNQPYQTRDMAQAATPEDVQDIVNQPYVTKDVTSYTPGLSRNEQIAKLLEMQMGGNKYVSAAAPTLTGLLPKAAEEEEYGTPFESGGQMYTMSKSGNVKALDLSAPTKESTYQRTTKEWSDKAGNKYKQDYAFNPTTKSMEPIGEAYLADVYHAPGTSKDDDTKAGATLRNEYNNHPVVKNHSIISSSYQTMLNTPAADPNDNTGAGDMSLIFNYMKMLDPNSVVREGEYATAQNAGSIPQRVINAYNNAVRGTKLDPTQRQNFLKQAKVIYDTSAENEKSVRQGILDIAKDTGVNPRLYTIPEPKRRNTGSVDLPSGFVVDQPSAQNTTMFQFPNQAF